MKNPSVIIIFLLSIFYAAQGQDIHFTQQHQSPLLTSPALTGTAAANIRVQLASRHQWRSLMKDAAYQTMYVSYDQRNLVGRNDFFGIGGMVWTDKAGQGHLSTTQVAANASYAKNIYRHRHTASYIVAGGMLGWANRSLKVDDLVWSEQYDGRDDFDLGLPTGENLENTRHHYLDVGAGLQYYQVSKTTSLQVGVAYYHFNKPKISFYENSKTFLSPKWMGHASGLWYLDKKNLSLLGNMVIHLQSPFLQVQTTTAARYHFGYQNKEYIEFGLGTRLAKAVDSTPVNALLFNVGYQLKSLKMGLSYDFPIAGLTDTGTFELTVGYLLDSHQRRGVLCPRF